MTITIQKDTLSPQSGLQVADLRTRAASVAAIAAKHAAEVDKLGRFPDEAVAAMRSQRLLGIAIPLELGGEGASIETQADICYTLGQACASAAMIYAMHLTKVACLVNHGRGEPTMDAIMRRIADQQLLMASSTTEGNNGGNVRSSEAAITLDGDRVRLDRAATVISYGAEADGVVTTARRAEDASGSDQVLGVFLKEDYTLEPLNGWETLGMRGTRSIGFRLVVDAPAGSVMKMRYAEIHTQTMTPHSHIMWTSAWTGIAASAVTKAQAFTRKVMRAAGGTPPPGAQNYARAVSTLRQARALIKQAIDRYDAAMGHPDVLADMEFQTMITMLKVEVSDLAVTTVMSAMRTNGLAGYREDGDFTVGRQLRDILSAPIMIHNDRIISNLTTATLMTPVAETLRA